MSDKTGISWTDATWNPIRGCSRVSEGCRNCYAERQAARFSGKGQPYEGLAITRGPMPGERAGRPAWTGEVRLIAEHLADPLRWKKPRRIFVNSMSDLFHEKLSDDDIDRVFAVMVLAKRHTFQVLTKRADRMRAYITTPGRHEAWTRAILKRPDHGACGGVGEEWWPRFSDHIWLGVSVENQAAADERIPELLATPAAVRFLSCEPLIGAVTLPSYEPSMGPISSPLDWVIAGCESGPGARSCSVEWLRSLRDQCAAAGVSYFLKQATAVNGGAIVSGIPVLTHAVQDGDGSKRKSGGVIELPYLDGVQHAAFPVQS